MAKRKSKSRPSRQTLRTARNQRSPRNTQQMIDTYRRAENSDIEIQHFLELDNAFVESERSFQHFGITPPKSRKIDGKTFLSVGNAPTSKENAEAMAEMQRNKLGRNARVIKSKKGFTVYVAPAKRIYSASLLERVASQEKILLPKTKTLTPAKKKKWFNFGRKKTKTGGIMPRSTKAELDNQEVEDFYSFKDQLSGGSLTEAEVFIKAEKAAKAQRRERENAIEISKSRNRLTKELRIATEREDIASYYQSVSDYNEAIPLSVVAKYNSLEIATASTAAVLGGAVAAGTAVAAWPLIPGMAVAGFLSAKIIRNNVGGIGLKQGLNSSLDAFEGLGGRTVESVRVSKDQGQTNWKSLGLLRQPSKVKPRMPIKLKETTRLEKRKQRRAARKKKMQVRREVRKGIGIESDEEYIDRMRNDPEVTVTEF